jgi:hypothetical protein
MFWFRFALVQPKREGEQTVNVALVFVTGRHSKQPNLAARRRIAGKVGANTSRLTGAR